MMGNDISYGTNQNLQKTRAPLHQARHMPGELYTSPEIYRLEKEHIFRKQWLCLARIEELGKPGDYLTFRVGDDPILLCQTRQGEFKAFYNVCRHRGTLIAADCGNKDSFQCPYHGWVYGLDGKLMGAPFTKEIEGFDRIDYGLKSIRLEIWGGFIFVNLDPEAGSLESYLGEFTDIFAPYRPEDCRFAFRIEIEYDSNWKTVAENLVDIYHIATLHADSFGTKQPLDSYEFNTYPWGYTGRFQGVSPMTLDGQPRFGFMPWLEGKHLEYGYSAHLLPNMGFYARQDNIHWATEWPLAVDRTTAYLHMMFPAPFLERPDFEDKVQDYKECLKLVVEEDRSMILALQKGFSSKGFEPGPMSKFERGVHHVINSNLGRILPSITNIE